MKNIVTWKEQDKNGNYNKIALLRLSRLVISDFQAIDRYSLRHILKNEEFCNVINHNVNEFHLIEVCVRIQTNPFDTVLKDWLEIKSIFCRLELHSIKSIEI